MIDEDEKGPQIVRTPGSWPPRGTATRISKETSVPAPPILVSFDEALGHLAKAVRDRRDAGTYTDGDERTLAERAVAALDTDDHEPWLMWLIEARVQRFLLGDCRLDPASDATYAIVDRVAEQILTGIQDQGSPTLDNLQTWTTSYITDHADLLRHA